MCDLCSFTSSVKSRSYGTNTSREMSDRTLRDYDYYEDVDDEDDEFNDGYPCDPGFASHEAANGDFFVRNR